MLDPLPARWVEDGRFEAHRDQGGCEDGKTGQERRVIHHKGEGEHRVRCIQKKFYAGYKATLSTDGTYLNLLYIDPANEHDLTILKENRDDFARRLKGDTVLLDKGYVDMRFEEEMRERGVRYTAIKRRNMIKSEKERLRYEVLARVRKIIETRFYQLNELGLRFVRAITRKGLAVKIILSILAFNIHQMMRIA